MAHKTIYTARLTAYTPKTKGGRPTEMVTLHLMDQTGRPIVAEVTREALLEAAQSTGSLTTNLVQVAYLES